MTWAQIITLEPELEAMRMSALAEKPSARHYWPTWERYKNRFSLYVGWNAKHEVLSSSDVFDQVYQVLLSAFSRKD